MPPPSLRDFGAYFLKLGAVGFGGPIALVGYMQRDLVEDRKWVSAEDYKEGLALSQLAPGPLAAQLAIYLGWVKAGIPGATLVGLAFVIPSFLMVLALSAAYVRFGGLAWMQGAFYGVGAAVIAIIARSAWKLASATMGKAKLMWAIFGLSAAVTAVTETEMVWLFLVCGVLGAVAARPPSPGVAVALFPWPLLFTGLHGPADGSVLWKIAWYFTEAGAFVFGSGLAIVPFLHGGVVNDFGWLTERQFVDAVAVAMITPGPVVITVGFIGYLVAGPAGAFVAAFATFLPAYLMVIGPAPYFRKYAKNVVIKGFVDGVTAAASGAIAGAAFVLGRRAIVDVPTALIALATLAALTWLKKAPEPILIVMAGVVGLALSQG
ncbi:chromate resistance transporter [Deltaproteobacteria bacterium]|nr:chromate resistance transporter [Deltaproteobacteria bacterium]